MSAFEIHHEDCLRTLRDIPDKAFDHTITDPPYEAEAHTKARRSLKDATQKRGAANTGEVRRIDQPLEINFGAITPELRDAVSAEIARVTKRWVVAFCQIEAIAAWRSSLERAGLDWIRGGIWRKPDGAPQFTGDRPGMGFESIAIAHHKGRKKWNGGGKHGVWTHPLEHGNGGGTRNEHPTQKPVRLMVELVGDFTDPDDLIFDPFMGAGTTGVAALRWGRRFFGIERDAAYYALAAERLAAEAQGVTLGAARAGQTALFAGAK